MYGMYLQDMRALMDVVQKKGEDVLDYWNRFKDAIQKHSDWIPDDESDKKRAELVNVLMDELLSEIREEIELRTMGWRKKSAPELVEIAYEVLQKWKDKVEKKEKTKMMNIQLPGVKEKVPEPKGVPVSTV